MKKSRTISGNAKSVVWAAFAASALLSTVALAGGTATMVTGEGQGQSQSMTVEFSDARTARMNVDGQGQGYMLMRDGHLYIVSDSGNGQPMVMDMAQMMGMARKMGFKPGSMGGEDVSQVSNLEATGRSETVAGIPGKVYSLTYVDGNGQSRSEELVLSSDKRAREFTEVFKNMGRVLSESSGGAQGNAALMTSIDGQNMGMLRYGSSSRISSFETAAPASSRFDLPGPVTQMPNLGGNPGGGADASGEAGGMFGGLFGNKAERQAERQQDRANSRADEETDKAVDNVMDRAMDAFFGR